MILAIVLLAAGVFFSAFFSGSETGFYRVTRVRLVMDAKSGSWIARCLLWMVSRPSVVVATVLIGNNLANYMVSLGLLLLTQSLFADWDKGVQMFLPVLATPALFIYGELLPKYLYYNAPYKLSLRGAPLMILCGLIFMPISSVIILLESAWQKLFGKASVRSKFSLERQELQRVLMEGQEAGVLQPVQREMAQNLFTYGARPVRHFTLPLRAMPLVPASQKPSRDLIPMANRLKQGFIGILNDSGNQLTGCYQVSDLLILGESAEVLPVHSVRAGDSNIHVLIDMQRQLCPLAQVFDAQGNAMGIVTKERLLALVLRED